MNTIKVEGLDKAVKEINKRIEKIGPVTEKALQEIGLDLVGKAQNLAPIDTGDLRGSGFSELEGNTVTVGFTEPYALRQHEDLSYKHPRGGQAKYLEQPLKENTDKYIKRLSDSVKKAVE